MKLSERKFAYLQVPAVEGVSDLYCCLQGCGFVTFALQEDAQRAVDELSGKKLGGRTIQARHR